jgi:hypothetical protein
MSRRRAMMTPPTPGDDPALDRRAAALLAAAPDRKAKQLAAATREPIDTVDRTTSWWRAQRTRPPRGESGLIEQFSLLRR